MNGLSNELQQLRPAGGNFRYGLIFDARLRQKSHKNHQPAQHSGCNGYIQ